MFVHPKPGGWTTNTDTITGLQIGIIATQLVNALDAVGGGTYAPAADITFSAGGAQWFFACNVDFTSASTVELAGPTTISGAHILSGAGSVTGSLTWASTKWPGVTSRTVTKQHALKLSTVILNVGTGGTEPSAYIGAPPDPGGTYFNLTTIGGLSVASEAIVGVRGLDANESSYFVIELPDPPDGQVLASVTLSTGSGGGGGGTLPKYTLVKWIAAGVLVPIGTVDVADTHTDPGTWGGSPSAHTPTDQVLTPTATTTIDNSTTKYGVLVKNAFAVGIPDGVIVYGVRAAYTVTSLRA